LSQIPPRDFLRDEIEEDPRPSLSPPALVGAFTSPVGGAGQLPSLPGYPEEVQARPTAADLWNIILGELAYRISLADRRT